MYAQTSCGGRLIVTVCTIRLIATVVRLEEQTGSRPYGPVPGRLLMAEMRRGDLNVADVLRERPLVAFRI
jgi:hypothetical protein